MQKLTVSELACAYSLFTHMNIVGMHLPESPSFAEIMLAAPILTIGDFQLISDGIGFIVCDTIEEALNVYHNIVGDDGSETNPYNGDVRVYAYVIEDGEITMENT